MNRKYTVFFILLFIGLWLAVGCTKEDTRLLPVWERMGIEPDSIELMELVYDGFAVPLREDSKAGFIRDLTASEPIALEDTHQYQPSDYLVRITLTTGEVKEYQFYWFMGKGPDDDIKIKTQSSKVFPAAVVVDRRFDLEINGKIYHYTFTGDYYWNEDISRTCYDRSSQFAKLPSRNKINGYDSQVAFEDLYLGVYYYEGVTWKDIIDRSDYVFLATFQGTVIEDSSTIYSLQSFLDYYHVERWLKGEIETTDFIFGNSRFPRLGENGFITGDSDSLHFPSSLLKGYELLICVQNNKNQDAVFSYSAEVLYSIYIVDREQCYSVENAESFLFQDVTVPMIEEYLMGKGEYNGTKAKEIEEIPLANDTEQYHFQYDPTESWQQIVSHSDTIVIGKYLGVALDSRYENPLELGMDLFSVRTVLKGEKEILDVIKISSTKGTLIDSEGHLYRVDYQPDRMNYEVGKEYMLFLSEDMKVTWTPHYEYRKTGELFYYDGSSVGKTILLNDDGVIAPCAANKDHPFQNVTLQMIQEYLEN